MADEEISEEDISYIEPDYEEGQTVFLEIEDGPLAGTYETEISELDGDKLTVPVPFINQIYLPVSGDEDITLKHFNEGASLESKTTILHRDESPDHPVLELSLPDELKRIQRRSYVRVSCSFDVEVFVLDTPNDEQITGSIEAESVDISAGGIQLKSSRELPEGTQIQLDFTLPAKDRKMSDVFGEILRQWKDEDDGLYHWAIEFSGLQENQRNDIIQYVYHREREQGD